MGPPYFNVPPISFPHPLPVIPSKKWEAWPLSLFLSVLPALSDLQLTTVGNESVQLRWKGSYDGLRGYWVTWERGQSQRSTLYLPPNRLSTTLNHVPSRARVCVSPVYRTARGEGLCCTA